MHPGSWRNLERDRDLHTTLRLINGMLAIVNIVLIGWLIHTLGTVLVKLFT